MLTIQSDDDVRYSTPKYFSTVADSSLDSSIPVSVINSAKRTKKPLTRRATAYTYNITWTVSRTKTNCMDCEAPLMPNDKTQSFIISGIVVRLTYFCSRYTTNYSAMSDTGISQAALDNAAMNGNCTITRRADLIQHERMVFDITWNPRCRVCQKRSMVHFPKYLSLEMIFFPFNSKN